MVEDVPFPPAYPGMGSPGSPTNEGRGMRRVGSMETANAPVAQARGPKGIGVEHPMPQQAPALRGPHLGAPGQATGRPRPARGPSPGVRPMGPIGVLLR